MLINHHQHAHVRCLPIENRLFAARETSIELVVDDVEQLAKHHAIPIILPAEPNALPRALLSGTGEHDPLSGYTPELWRAYPFSLLPDVIGADTSKAAAAHTVLWADEQAPHWSMTDGDLLFTADGHPSAFLDATIQRLQLQEKRASRTRELIAFFHKAGALRRTYIEYEGQTHAVYQIVMDGLEARLEAQLGTPRVTQPEDALDVVDSNSMVLVATYFASLIHQSQQGLIELDSTVTPFSRARRVWRFRNEGTHVSHAVGQTI